MTVIARGDGILPWRQVADALEDEIRSGRLGSGARLPTEAALAARFAVNRHTVRRALAALSALGLVRSTQGSGSFVEAAPLAYPIGARTRFSEIIAGGGREPGGELIAAQTQAADAATAAALALPEGASVLRLDLRRRVDGVPMSLARSEVPLPRFAGLDAMLRAGATLSQAFARLGAPEYRRTRTRLTARLASAEEARHLELSPGRPVLAVTSVNVDEAGVPVQSTAAVFAADRVEVVVDS